MEKGQSKWYKSISNWIIIAACVILIPILIMNLSVMFQAKTNEEAVPSIFGYKPFMVLSGSMESKIRKGDLIITKVIENPNKLNINDVIAFRDAENTVTTHRIIDKVIEKGQTYFITKGDNNTSQDLNLVSLNDVEGIYVGRIPGVGSLMSSLSEPTTILIIVFGITIIFGMGFLISTKKQNAIERQEFLEYKRMKELEMLQKTESKKTSTSKPKKVSKESSTKAKESSKETVKKKTAKNDSKSKSHKTNN